MIASAWERAASSRGKVRCVPILPSSATMTRCRRMSRSSRSKLSRSTDTSASVQSSYEDVMRSKRARKSVIVSTMIS